MALLSRTHAIRAALVAGILLIFLNLIGLRLDLKFDRSNLAAHMSSQFQWPKRTHTNSPFSHNTHSKASTEHNDSSALYAVNFTSTSHPLVVKETFNTSNNKESGDIKNSSDTSSVNIVVNMDVEILSSSKLNNLNNSISNSSGSEAPRVEHTHPVKMVALRPNGKKYITNFDAAPESSGLLTSIMKVFGMNKCPEIPPNLDGPVEVDTDYESEDAVNKKFEGKLQPGGRFKPNDCRARDRVAIVIPFRDREQHLPILLKNLHTFLMKQQIDYGIFVVEQSSTGSFNRASLMNIGYVEALKLYEWDCFIFHDVDLLPLDDRNLYNCPDQPRHMSVAVDTFGFKLPYSSIFGGVSAMTTAQFRSVNGFSNAFYGWGGEDDDMSNRLKHVGFHIARYPVNIARYKMLTHKKEKANPKRYEKLVTGANRFNSDGLNSLKYKLIALKLKTLYTWVQVEITQENGR